MAKTPLFARLRRLYREGRNASLRARGEEPREVSLDEALRRRRAFLQGSAVALAALGIPAALPGCGDDETAETGEETIAIVGAGIAGLHCAHRLLEGGKKATVYEALDRVGGRMFTGRSVFTQAPTQILELGGELIDTNHATLWALSEEFGIALDDRFAPEFEPAGTKRDLYVINGVEVPEETIIDQFSQVAGVMEEAYAAAEDENDDAPFIALDETSLDDWLVTNVPPATYPELHAILQTAYRGEYGLENDQQSALNLIYLIGADTPDEFRIFGDSDERYHTHLGNDTFTTALADALEEGQIQLEHRLTKVVDAEGGYELTFATPSGDVTVNATRVVFALPFSVLRTVDLAGLTLSEDKRAAIMEVGYGTNAKVMMGFTTRVWRTAHQSSGSLTTDAPVQQTWETTIGQDGDHGILTNFLGGEQGSASAAGTADDWARDVALPDLEDIWPGTSISYTGEAVRMHWPTVPTSLGSYTCYQPGQWYAFYGIEGVREGNLHFCGEHTSADFQGWMEGAAETGALVAAEIIADAGDAQPQGMVRALGVKLAVQHPCYRAPAERMHPLRRRREIKQVMARLAAIVDTTPR